ncbi:MAG: response regulator [Methylococcaceae bacterium]|nr:response regulator [Methylococcaceae bacterium]
MMGSIKVLLVDDHTVVRAGFRLLLSSSQKIEVIAEAERGEQALMLYSEFKPDIVVMDLSMPGIGGLECIRRLCQRDSEAKVLVFSIHDEAVYIDRAMSAGAKGYISKNSAAEIMLEAIYDIAQGKPYIEAGLNRNTLLDSELIASQTIVDNLNTREFDIFCLLAKGLTAHDIAAQLCLSYKTIANYNTQIKNKFQVGSVVQLAHIAIALKLI